MLTGVAPLQRRCAWQRENAAFLYRASESTTSSVFRTCHQTVRFLLDRYVMRPKRCLPGLDSH